MFDSLVHLASGSAWTYAIVLGFAAADVIAPVIPSETLVVASGALAASGRLNLALILVAATLGAVLGDNAAYLVGRLFGPRVERRLRRGSPKLAARLAWAHGQLELRGGTIIFVARFIPGGRTVTMLSAGILRMRWRRFAILDLAAAIAWALYAGLIGFLGGSGFENEPVIGVGVAVGISFALGLLVEIVRRLRGHGKR